MICYRDRSYCSASTDGRCHNYQCDRQYTEMERQKAALWWKEFRRRGEPPVAFADFWPNCTIRVPAP